MAYFPHKESITAFSWLTCTVDPGQELLTLAFWVLASFTLAWGTEQPLQVLAMDWQQSWRGEEALKSCLSFSYRATVTVITWIKVSDMGLIGSAIFLLFSLSLSSSFSSFKNFPVVGLR